MAVLQTASSRRVTRWLVSSALSLDYPGAGRTRSLGAAVTLLVLFVLGLGPVSAFLGIVLQQALTMSDQAIPWLNQHLGAATTFNVQEWVVKRFPALAKYVPSQEQLLEQVGTAARTAVRFLSVSPRV